jgi:hypothetical protein
MGYRVTDEIASKSRSSLAAALAVFAIIAASSVAAGATPLPPNNTIVTPSLLTDAPGDLVAVGSSDIDSSDIAATFFYAVFDPAGGGSALDFYYQIFIDDNGATDTLDLATILPFPIAVVTDVFYRTDDVTGFVAIEPPAAAGPGAIPAEARRNPNGTVRFDFSDGVPGEVAPGEASAIMVVRTNVPYFGLGEANFSGLTSGDSTAFAPIPEPGSLLLLGSGLAGLAGMARLRQRRNKVTAI